MDYRLLFDDDWLKAIHLGSKERRVKIEKVEQGQLENKGKKTRKPVIVFAEAGFPKGSDGKQLRLAANKTNAKVIARAYGNDTADWIGREIILYPTQTDMAGDTVDCIRVKLVAVK